MINIFSEYFEHLIKVDPKLETFQEIRDMYTFYEKNDNSKESNNSDEELFNEKMKNQNMTKGELSSYVVCC